MSVAHWVAAAARGGCGCLGLAAHCPGVGHSCALLVARTRKPELTSSNKHNERKIRTKTIDIRDMLHLSSSGSLGLLCWSPAPLPHSEFFPYLSLELSCSHSRHNIPNNILHKNNRRFLPKLCCHRPALRFRWDTPFWRRSEWVDAQVKLCAALPVHHPFPLLLLPLPPSLSPHQTIFSPKFILGRVKGLPWALIGSPGANRLLRLVTVLSLRDGTRGVGPAPSPSWLGAVRERG